MEGVKPARPQWPRLAAQPPLPMDSGHGNYSAGDRVNCCQDTTGINRAARVEIYVK